MASFFGVLSKFFLRTLFCSCMLIHVHDRRFFWFVPSTFVSSSVVILHCFSCQSFGYYWVVFFVIVHQTMWTCLSQFIYNYVSSHLLRVFFSSFLPLLLSIDLYLGLSFSVLGYFFFPLNSFTLQNQAESKGDIWLFPFPNHIISTPCAFCSLLCYFLLVLSCPTKPGPRAIDFHFSFSPSHGETFTQTNTNRRAEVTRFEPGVHRSTSVCFSPRRAKAGSWT